MTAGAAMVLNTDSHAPEDLIDDARAAVILKAAGIPEESINSIFANYQKLVDKVGRD